MEDKDPLLWLFEQFGFNEKQMELFFIGIVIFVPLGDITWNIYQHN